MRISTPGDHLIFLPESWGPLSGPQRILYSDFFLLFYYNPSTTLATWIAFCHPPRDLCRCPLYLDCFSRPVPANSVVISLPLRHSDAVFWVNVLPKFSGVVPQSRLSNSAWGASELTPHGQGACFPCLSLSRYLVSLVSLLCPQLQGLG